MRRTSPSARRRSTHRAIFTLALGLALAPVAAPGSSNLTQGDWVKLLVQRLGLTRQFRSLSAEDAIALFSSRVTPTSETTPEPKLVNDMDGQKTWRFDLVLPKSSIYVVAARPRRPSFVRVDDQSAVLVSRHRAGAAKDVGRYPMLEGPHSIAATVAADLPAPTISLVTGCHYIAPASGWSAGAELSFGTMARTLVRAIRQDGRLPAAEALPPVAIAWDRIPLTAPVDGIYTLEANGVPKDVTFRIDGCEENGVGSKRAEGWREGTTTFLKAGRHVVSVFGVDPVDLGGRVRLVRRDSSDGEYLAVLKKLGVPVEKMANAVGGAGRARTGSVSSAASAAEAEPLAEYAGLPVTMDLAVGALDLLQPHLDRTTTAPPLKIRAPFDRPANQRHAPSAADGPTEGTFALGISESVLDRESSRRPTADVADPTTPPTSFFSPVATASVERDLRGDCERQHASLMLAPPDRRRRIRTVAVLSDGGAMKGDASKERMAEEKIHTALAFAGVTAVSSRSLEAAIDAWNKRHPDKSVSASGGAYDEETALGIASLLSPPVDAVLLVHLYDSGSITEASGSFTVIDVNGPPGAARLLVNGTGAQCDQTSVRALGGLAEQIAKTLGPGAQR